MSECDHIYGIEYYPYEGGELIKADDIADVYPNSAEWFKFCPQCGSALPRREEL